MTASAITEKQLQSRIQDLVAQAIEAANQAGDEWMSQASPKYAVYNADIVTGDIRGPALGTLLDLCGNAHVRFRNKGSRWFKTFKKFGFIRATESGVVEIWHKYKPRQEYGLQVACASAAKQVLENGGVTGLVIWEYVD